MKKILLWLGACLLLTGGCVFFQNDYVEPQDYDLTPSKPVPAGTCNLQFGVLRNFSGADRRILVRLEDGTIHRDEYRHWSQDPELLIQRYFYESLQGGSDVLPVVKVTGSLYRFEYVSSPASARFLAGFTLNYQNEKREVRCDYSVPVDGKAAPITAMNECLSRAAVALQNAAAEMVKKAEKK